MPVFQDQLNRAVAIPEAPGRIISLVPSITELLFQLGLGEKVVGVTKFCVHPAALVRSKTQIGGTKNPHVDLIQKLQPDLILANKEENREADIQELEKEFPVWVTDVQTVEEALEMIRGIGNITGYPAEAENICQHFLQEKKDWLEWKQQHGIPSLRTLYLIWKEPYMTVGRDTFIHDMLTLEGSVSVLPEATRYPILTTEDIIALQPERVLLSSEPYPFKEQHRAALQSLLPDCRVALVDGEMFSWYGSRMLLAPRYFRKRWEDIGGYRD